MFTKRGNVGLITFSLIISLYLSIYIGTYYYTSSEKDDFITNNLNLEVSNSLYSLRGNLIDLTKFTNSSLVYENKYDLQGLKVILSDSYIYGSIIKDNNFAELNISNLGINFCSSYNVSLVVSNTFYFNGSCIAVI